MLVLERRPQVAGTGGSLRSYYRMKRHVHIPTVVSTICILLATGANGAIPISARLAADFAIPYFGNCCRGCFISRGVGGVSPGPADEAHRVAGLFG
jgi:hypothetical protein